MAEFLENRIYDDIQVGQIAGLERTLTRDDVALFSKVSGDLNPIHIDEEYARSQGAKGVVGHSLWATSLVSSLLANVLPGPGTVYRSQDATFHRQVALGDTLKARITVLEKRPEQQILFECLVLNQHDQEVMTGMALVVAPTERLRIEAVDVGEISVHRHDSFAALLEQASSLEPVPTAVVHPVDQVSLEGAIEAAQSGFIRSILVGPAARIRAVAEEFAIELAGVEIIDVEHSHAAAARAVALIREGSAEILMKGSLHTDEVLSAVLDKVGGIRTARRISHIFVMDVPTYPKLLLISDAAVNIAPDLEAKVDICQNAIDLARTVGVERPKVAILSAVEKIWSWLDTVAAGGSLMAIGHRVAHGGETYARPALIDATFIAELTRLIPLVPLHQPSNLAPIRAIAADHPGLPQVACFDTSFHRGRDKVTEQLALPRALLDRGVKRYGFHGLSYEFIAHRLQEIAPEVAAGRVVVAHLGSGCSMTALRDGRSVETSMGFSALDGVPMGTRPGALDAGVLLYLLREDRMTVTDLEDLLYKRSGLLGLSGVSNDLRALHASDDPGAAEAIDFFVYRVGQMLGALCAALGGIDALVFTAGVGENDAEIRARICRDAAWLGIEIDADANAERRLRISPDDKTPSVWVIPTDEEAMIARHTLRIVRGG
ncbi:hypothetical protein CCR95_00810 [Thiocystis minor]|uniref:bifunctional enoyl-CoA hydratase/phosphate acetyltransferase n=1 Tax=Thiocystis minor TaxID=61597 RepID=UPI001F5D5A5E|nr:bifunctional enoyl-CoA hydratase/phosphate acetyltransferase [Thiocystis minor]MBK5962678.1 hypothetical protein [Thiocystis minor]